MKVSEKTRVNIQGAGLVGSLLAVYMTQRGHDVTVHEYRGDMRGSNVDGGRSINLAISNRGWKALRKVGMEDAIRKISIPMSGRLMHDKEGNLTPQPYGIEGEAIYSVSRGGLNMELMNAAEKSGAKLEFNQKCRGVDVNTASIYLRDLDTNKEYTAESDITFGADGAFSKVRASLQRKGRFSYSQQYLDHAYKELTIPPTENGKWRIEKNALHIWPRESFMLIALPNLDGSFTVTLFLAFEGEKSFAALDSDEKIMAFFNEEFPDAVPHMPELIKDFHENPTSALCTVRCNPWTNQKNVALIGDAAHAVVPFYGQGMNAGFEDCDILDDIIEAHPSATWAEILCMYEDERIANGNAIADLALYNFIEMRDNVADPRFLAQKKIETWVRKNFPEYLPLYTMVTFTHLPYSEAKRRGEEQRKFWMQLFKQKPELETEWESDKMRDWYLQELKAAGYIESTVLDRAGTE